MTDHTRRRDEALPHRVRGAADRNFSCTVRGFSKLFPGRKFGGGALAIYQDGQPVVDVWTGYSDREGTQRWSADTGAMVFSATKGMASTTIHRLVDRGLIDYDSPVCAYWPEFAANGKSAITVRQVMAHEAGLSQLNGVSKVDLLDHRGMESRVAAAQVNSLLFGKPAYHALTYGWLLSGLARAVTGQGMRELFRIELAEPLGTDGLHLGRPPADAPTRVAQILAPQRRWPNHVFDFVAPRAAALNFSGAFGSMYFPGAMSLIQGDIPFLDSEAPAVNGVATARGLARMYGAIANQGRHHGVEFLSEHTLAGLTGPPASRRDRNLGVPLGFHLGYHSVPFGVMSGFGHVGLGGSVGWADPASGLAIGFVHNRLLTPMVLDMAAFVGLNALIRNDVARARAHGYEVVPDLGASPYEVPKPAAG
ncbi:MULTISPECIES: serine hydrolase domain-containing protein [unclassified Mycolicibacterium]|uniref:esterase/beta-lactamase LipL n=1 Tax=unclassified Mycolicibacterium TaxID=2636767 RepID=UPI00130CBEC9|nr:MULTISPECIES: serine hydrolase domain-containing protein [unclassified Mycolicibacterium]MUL84550.1 beta-lactamase family protein [Mycolicibacterium sp. CBMA 329]MUL88325.1 beta-lactamase family protein [Mycolicibacterium sp. CBMA 331]MUL99226.1 beta-lactamase family protein [Mycolicibacterium sp. CBMA 334]MUM27568.1 beta-lactamase family protein [Mycolicibacterium sp. CBMA 295]MUM39972.1 beta-lactamase family protein [Mycolicibacterium sp. CBMA 247]